ncbi:MAG: hypothetical protein JWR84_34 [Caulobacter sp.]|nr:hypothetical protein [Caulobacter sp.]
MTLTKTAGALTIALALGLTAAGQAGACSIDANGKLSVKKGDPYPGAKGKAWYSQGKALTLDGDSYKKTGSPRVFGESEFSFIKKVGEMEGIPFYRDEDLPNLLFVPIDAATCTFHAYDKG